MHLPGDPINPVVGERPAELGRPEEQGAPIRDGRALVPLRDPEHRVPLSTGIPGELAPRVAPAHDGAEVRLRAQPRLAAHGERVRRVHLPDRVGLPSKPDEHRQAHLVCPVLLGDPIGALLDGLPEGRHCVPEGGTATGELRGPVLP